MRLLDKLPDPSGLDKHAIVNLLLREEYGYLPARPYQVSAKIESEDKKFCAGKASLKKLLLCCQAEWGEFSFPVYYVCPQYTNAPVPCFIHINFSDLVPHKYQPTEELVDAGYATLTFCYLDVASDSSDFTDGLAGVIYPDGKRKSDACGKIGLWAWATSAVMDYAVTLPELDCRRISVAGHSRLGKTALLAGALDERFYCAFSNDSGCSGAAIARGADGETVKAITDRFPYWFSENYLKYSEHEDTMPFDQHYLLAANLPHRVYVASAAGDLWASPKNEYLSCVAASAYYKAHGMRGFVHPNRLPNVGECLHAGDIGYHLRSGSHYFSREDWLNYIKYLSK